MSMLSIFNIFEGPHEVTNPITRKDFEYPAEAIINPEDIGLTLKDYKSRADDDGDELYKNAQGYSDINGVIDSPYFTAHVEGKRIPALAIVVENPGGSISNVTYENIYMHSVASRPIGCLIYNNDIQNFSITGVKYKSITYSSAKQPNKIASNGKNTNKIQADFENIYYNGMKITDVNSGIFEYDSNATITIK